MVDGTDIPDWCYYEAGISDGVSIPTKLSNDKMWQSSPIAHVSSKSVSFFGFFGFSILLPFLARGPKIQPPPPPLINPPPPMTHFRGQNTYADHPGR